jgi:hypothetical protein
MWQRKSEAFEPWLLVYDTGVLPFQTPWRSSRVVHVHMPAAEERRIGRLRNEANGLAGKPDVIVHWDSDDWSSPDRLALQIAQLGYSGGAGVGFQNLLFLDTRLLKGTLKELRVRHSEAWEYDYKRRDRVLGTSMCYPRELWERNPFNESKMDGEDTEFHKVVPFVAYNGVEKPVLIAQVHDSNTSGVYKVFDDHKPAFQPEWRRAPEWDQFCREKLYA